MEPSGDVWPTQREEGQWGKGRGGVFGWGYASGLPPPGRLRGPGLEVSHMTADHRETIVAALTRLGMLLVAEEVPCRGVPGQLIRYVNEHWPTDDGGEELRRQP